MPTVDIDALLGAEPLVLTVRGSTYTIADLPVKAAMELSRAAARGQEADSWVVLDAVCAALGIERAEMESWGTVTALKVVHEIMAHFSRLLERADLALPAAAGQAAAEVPSTGPKPSAPSSDTSEAATH